MLRHHKRSEWLFGIALLLFFGFWAFALTDSFPTPKPNTQKQESAEPKSKQESIQDISAETVAHYTKVLAWFTGVLASVSIAQGIFLYRTDKTARITANAARDAAEAAKESADSAVATERAWMFVVITHQTIGSVLAKAKNFDNSPSMNASPTIGPVIGFRFTNYGRTPAIIKELSIGDIVCAKAPIDPVFTIIPAPFKHMVFAVGEETDLQSAKMNTQFTHGEALEVAKGEKWFWFSGQLAYEDVFGEPHTHRFYWRGNGMVALQPYDYKHYNQST